ncbi:MAG: hypothetical protein JWN45_3031 [Acidobacteriaceae bacterium]|nr:hypothetical protein [Acidobacteriaceae bacterium]
MNDKEKFDAVLKQMIATKPQPRTKKADSKQSKTPKK